MHASTTINACMKFLTKYEWFSIIFSFLENFSKLATLPKKPLDYKQLEDEEYNRPTKVSPTSRWRISLYYISVCSILVFMLAFTIYQSIRINAMLAQLHSLKVRAETIERIQQSWTPEMFASEYNTTTLPEQSGNFNETTALVKRVRRSGNWTVRANDQSRSSKCA